MLNIEIHGLNKAEASCLEDKIFFLFMDEEYAGDIVITTYRTRAADIVHKRVSFIRIVTGQGEDRIREVLNKLRTLEVNVELLCLKEFIPVAQYYLTPK